MVGAPSTEISKVADVASGMSCRSAHEKQNVPHCETPPDAQNPRDRSSGSRPRAGGGLGRGSKLGRRCVCIRPPSLPVLQTAPSRRLDSAAGVLGPQDPRTSGRRPCPGEGAITACHHIDDQSRCYSLLREHRASTAVWNALNNMSLSPISCRPRQGADDACRRPRGPNHRKARPRRWRRLGLAHAVPGGAAGPGSAVGRPAA